MQQRISHIQNSQRRITPPPPYNHQNQSQQQQHQQAHQSNLHAIGSIHSNAVTGSNGVHHHQNQNTSSSLITNNGGASNANHPTNGARSNSSSTSSSASSSNNQSIDRVLNNPSNAVKTLVVRYNRRNNPELEKRRIHHCDFLGEFAIAKFIFSFTSLKLHSCATAALAAYYYYYWKTNCIN